MKSQVVNQIIYSFFVTLDPHPLLALLPHLLHRSRPHPHTLLRAAAFVVISEVIEAGLAARGQGCGCQCLHLVGRSACSAGWPPFASGAAGIAPRLARKLRRLLRCLRRHLVTFVSA